MEAERRSFGRLWIIEPSKDDGDNEFHWSPELEEQQIQDHHIVNLVEGVESRCSNLTVGAKNVSDSKALLLACSRASGAPCCSAQELDATVLRIVSHVVAQKLGSTLCGYPASVSVEGTSLVLTLQRFSGPLDETFLSELQASVGDFFVREATALVTLDLARGRGSVWKRGNVGLGETLEQSTWRDLLEGSRDLDLTDDLTGQEQSLGGQLAAKSLSEARVVAGEDEAGASCLLAPLGILGDSNNPILAAMVTAGTALITDSIAGGGDIHGYTVRSVALRGCRGCAVGLCWQRTCTIS